MSSIPANSEHDSLPESTDDSVELANIMAALAAELAAHLMPVPQICQKYGLSTAQLKALMGDPQFRHMIKDFRSQWNSPLNARDRIRAKAAILVEDGLLDIAKMFKDPQLPASARLDAMKQLTQLGDALPTKDFGGASGPTFSLTLNLGGDKPLTLESPSVQRVEEDA